MKLSVVAPLVLLLLAAGTYFVLRPDPEVSGVHYHAAFHVYANGERVDFEKFEYMHIEPCSDDDDEEALTPAQEQGEKAHLHDMVGDVVHVHRDAVTWGDLFRNLDYAFGEQPVSGYRNGDAVPDVLSTVIQPDDRILILQGALEGEQAAYDLLPTIEDIRTVESTSESCGS